MVTAVGIQKTKFADPTPGTKCFMTVLHSLLFLFFAYASNTIANGMEKLHLVMGRKVDDPEIERWKTGVPCYFTFWNLVLQQVYFTSCCADNFVDILPFYGLQDLQLTARRIRRVMLGSVLFPCACTVVVNFWCMYLFMPYLVFGDFVEATPSWVNHACHTWVLPASLLELYIRSKSEGVWQSGTYKGLYMLYALNTAYTISVLGSAAYWGYWPYPFLDDMNNWMRAMFFLSVYVSSWLWLAMQRGLVTKVWGRAEEDVSARKSLKGKKKK